MPKGPSSLQVTAMVHNRCHALDDISGVVWVLFSLALEPFNS